MPRRRGRAIRTAAELGGAPGPTGATYRGGRAVAVGAAAVLLTVTGAAPVGARSPAPHPGPAGLPPGWELCLLHGVGAPVTSANVADLDEWQVAEGGSTANDVAYNPFNTRRSTDQAQASLPSAFTGAGFPAFATWTAGCAATVATILQPNMAPIVTALAAGNVSPPGAFLRVVDRTQWCAPSNNVPCYLSFISGTEVRTVSSAMDLYRSTTTSLAAYDADVRAAAAVETTLAGQRQVLAVDDLEVSLAAYGEQRALGALRRAALYQYTSSPALDQMANLVFFQAPSERDLVQQVYSRVGVGDLVGAYRRAQAVRASAQADRQVVAEEVDRTVAALASARVAVGQALARADLGLAALQAAGACAPAPGAPTAGDGPQLASLRSCLGALGA